MTTKKDAPTIIVRKMPLIIKKSNQIMLLNNEMRDVDVQNFLYKDDVIYKGKDLDYSKSQSSDLLLVNRSHRFQNTSRTIVKYFTEEGVTEKTSDNVANLIGQKNYDTVFSALCSVLSQDLKVKGILALLTTLKNTVDSYSQTDLFERPHKQYTDASTQTNEKYLKIKKNTTHVKRKKVMPYIVKNNEESEVNVWKIMTQSKNNAVTKPATDTERLNTSENDTEESIINTEKHFECKEHINNVKNHLADKPDLIKHVDTSNIGFCFEENSNHSLGNISVNSVNTNNSNFDDLSVLYNVDKHIEFEEPYVLRISNYSINLRMKPEDDFHIATKENLKHLSPLERQKLLLYQAEIDWKNCLNSDEDGNLPLHIAVMNNDVELLKRHCAMLKIKKQSVDIPAPGNYTALKMSILKDLPLCTGILLNNGADPLQVDEDHRMPLHYAAEGNVGNVEAILKYCRENARSILQENKELWKLEYARKFDDNLSKYLLDSMCTQCDSQGNTPLMLACRQGKHENVNLLVAAGPNSVNQKMPTCGNTALYLAITSACADSIERGNKAKLDHKYQATIQILLENGADPSIDNYAGGNVYDLLAELNIPEISTIISNQVAAQRFCQGEGLEESKKFDSFMLVKSEPGLINIMDLGPKKSKKNLEVKSAVGGKSKSESLRKSNNVKLKSAREKNERSNISPDKTQTCTSSNVKIDNVKIVKTIPVSNQTIHNSSKESDVHIIDNYAVKFENKIITSTAQQSPKNDNLVLKSVEKRRDSFLTSSKSANTPSCINKTDNSKSVGISGNGSAYVVVNNLNVPSSKLIPIQKSSSNIQIDKANALINVSKAENNPIVLQMHKGVPQISTAPNKKPVQIESIIIKSPENLVSVNKKPEFVDIYKNFVVKDNNAVENINRKRKNVIILKNSNIKKCNVEKE